MVTLYRMFEDNKKFMMYLVPLFRSHSMPEKGTLFYHEMYKVIQYGKCLADDKP